MPEHDLFSALVETTAALRGLDKRVESLDERMSSVETTVKETLGQFAEMRGRDAAKREMESRGSGIIGALTSDQKTVRTLIVWASLVAIAASMVLGGERLAAAIERIPAAAHTLTGGTK